MSAHRLLPLGLAALFGVAGCYSGIPEGNETATDGDTDSDEGGGTAGPGDPGVPLCDADAVDIAGPRLLRRLTTAELEASVRVTFGLDAEAWTGPALPPDPATASGFTNDADRLRVTEGFAAALQTTAEQVASQVSEPVYLAQLLPCSTDGGIDCAHSLVSTFGHTLYRRPLSDTEFSRYIDLYDAVSPDEGFHGFAYWAVATMLQSPNFIYRSELGEPDGEGGHVLSPYEVATALSYTFLGTPPDEALLDLAASGQLQSSDDILKAARQLAFDETGRPRAGLRARLHLFHRQWLGLSALANTEKDPVRYPGFTEAIRASMQVELDRFLEHVVFEEGGGVQELLTADHSELDGALAAYYGFGQAGQASPKPEGWGTGLLSLGAVLATHSTFLATSPTQRGYMVRSRLICQPPPPPPPDIGDLPEPDEASTTRERYEQHASDPSCSGCHQLMDPIGYGFEGLDASGRFRQEDNGHPIDDSGAVVGLDGETIAFAGPVELAQTLAESQSVSDCIAAQMGSFAFGLDANNTQCIVDGPAAALAAGEVGLVEAFVEFAGTQHFRRRN